MMSRRSTRRSMLTTRRPAIEIPIHVDAASGGFILPFLNPEVKWDFRLKWVLSISTSGHKYGLVYPGLGWVVWKDKKYLPDEMSFSGQLPGREYHAGRSELLASGGPGAGTVLQFPPPGIRGLQGDSAEFDGHRHLLPRSDRQDEVLPQLCRQSWSIRCSSGI